MGKYTKKPKAKEEVAVMETSGVRTRARALAQEAMSALQLRSRCLPKPAPTPVGTEGGACWEGSKQGSDCGSAASRGFSRKKGGAHVGKEASFDMQSCCGEDPVGARLMGRKTNANSLSSEMSAQEMMDIHRLSTPDSAHRSIPCIHEVDEFFSEAEQFHLGTFAEKYNYDFTNDLPLPGRYEWVRMVQ